MNLERFTDASKFYERAAPCLMEHEAENCLMLGVAAELANYPEIGGYGNPYLATVEEEGTMIAASMMTPPRNVMVSSGVGPRTVSLFARDLHEAGWKPPGVTAEVGVARHFAEAWRGLTGQSSRRGMAQRIHRLETVRPTPETPGRMRCAADEDRARLLEWFAALDREALGGSGDAETARVSIGRVLELDGSGLYLWEDGEPVAMAGYRGGAPNVARVVAVYTPSRFRNRGYATACVAALSRLLLDGGYTYCSLYTDLANPTSNSVYQRIGYEPVCDVDEYRFV